MDLGKNQLAQGKDIYQYGHFQHDKYDYQHLYKANGNQQKTEEGWKNKQQQKAKQTNDRVREKEMQNKHASKRRPQFACRVKANLSQS